MRSIRAGGFVRHGNNLMTYCAPAAVFREFSRDFDATKNVPEAARENPRERLRELQNDCEGFGLRVTLAGVTKLLGRLDSPADYTFGDLERECGALQGRLMDELDSHLFLGVDVTRARFYEDPLGGWESAIERFPSVSFDVEEAGKCLALDRGTACVFHLMRVLEPGLYTLARALGIENVQINWQNAIDQIEKAIRDLPRADSRKTFYSEAAAHFVHVKDAWRNRATHSGQAYPVEKAEQVLVNVRSFMQLLATRLGEQT